MNSLVDKLILRTKKACYGQGKFEVVQKHYKRSIITRIFVQRNLLSGKHFVVCVVHPELGVIGRVIGLVARNLVKDGQVMLFEHLGLEYVLCLLYQ